MPVILEADAWNDWLSSDSSPEAVGELLVPVPGGALITSVPNDEYLLSNPADSQRVSSATTLDRRVLFDRLTDSSHIKQADP